MSKPFSPADLAPSLWWKDVGGVMMDMLTGQPLNIPGNGAAETIAFDRALSDGERAKVEQSLADEHGVLPPDEPTVVG